MSFWFLPLLHQAYSIIGQLLSLAYFSFHSASFFIHLFQSITLHNFVSENGNDSSLLPLTPLIHWQMTSALPLVAALCTVSVHWGRLRICLGEKTQWLKDFFRTCWPAITQNRSMHQKETLSYMWNAQKMWSVCAAALSDLAKHFLMFKFPSLWEDWDTLKHFTRERLL